MAQHATSAYTGSLDSADLDETEYGAPRVGHKKSRNGCAQCKRRHVKCNEARPCSNCVRHGVACSLAGGPNVPRDDLKSRRSPTDSTPSRIESTSEPDVLPGIAYRGSSPLRRLTQTIDRRRAGLLEQTWMTDLQLMHHFDTHAHELLSEADVAHLWQQEIPRLAFSSHYIMHILLGISALHMASQQPQRARILEVNAVSHLDQALAHYRQEDPVVSAENAEAKFCFSFMVCLFAYATPVAGSPVDALCDIFTLVRGIDMVASEAFVWVASGAFAPMINRSLHEVLRLAPDNGVEIPQGMELGVGHLDYMLAVDHLVYSNVVQAGSATGIALIICWPKQDCTAFSRMLKCRVPQALVILAYYCVVLDLLDHKWYLKRWGSQVLQDIVLNLDEKWKSWIQWPVKTVLMRGPAASIAMLDEGTKMIF
ncbi:hypothetical protein AMS68_002885 [Peltaster fructicola]|uniref:Zn(2)-C6 fungal-type domain-containing protein n=1 Tax=Peltaster fructicola TaxID=286661 RepID=A0A6H0XRW5_9PEZI|nr:hypothetical protein AMS68_002885 [Peltaster fructicola]